ncbi:hypothetical protein A3752_02080 [Oleiphilus sp. HI0081]|nr:MULTISPECIES: putative solute-binding protein [unclassified Oleiphilus]KZZ19339.1 hypothetical protein A3752_02080 [Oleiphilus sp. HI0081]KZZ32083.1 hypothetical protein A3757_00720 [Oleiphilus sp. HI0117]KZZ62891.1 hypothetical protein A3763_07400 [Oleiphilus sp. HI0128]
MKYALYTFFSFVIYLFSTSAFSLEKKSICTWDPVGTNGPVMTFYADLKPKAIAWGIDLEFKAYTDEKVASNDFKAGICDAAHLSAILSRDYVPFGGSLDAIGGIMSDQGLNKILATLASPKAGTLMSNGKYEIVASFPVGSMYVFVNDKSINTVPDFSGKKISVLNGDPQAFKLASLAGASPVSTSLATFSGQFNNGNIDILLMPALAYNTFELYHGLGEQGGIIDYRLFYGMLQTVIKKENFAPDFGNKMRKYMVSRLTQIHKMVKDAEDEIPAKYWIKTSDASKSEFDTFSRDIRLALKEDSTFNPKALRLLWKIRCAEDPSRAECSTPE